MPPNFEPPLTPSSLPEGRPNLPPPVPNPLRQDHSMPVGEQHSVNPSNLPASAGNSLFQPDKPSVVSDNPAYDFILNPAPVSRAKAINLPRGPLSKIAIGLVGVLVVIILFAIISSLFKSPSNVAYLSSVLEDQAELVHLSTNAANEPDISGNNQNFVATASLALSSNSSSLETYLKVNGHSINSKLLSAKISISTDQQLANAETAGDFNSTFNQVMTAELNGYLSDLKTAYSKTSGLHGRALLTSFYNQANLLQVSLSNGS